jgi:hypothetical protein
VRNGGSTLFIDAKMIASTRTTDIQLVRKRPNTDLMKAKHGRQTQADHTFNLTAQVFTAGQTGPRIR